MSVVLDSSATLTSVYADETTAAIRDVFNQVVEGGAWVPGLWRLEIANMLEMGIRRGRHNAAFRDAAYLELALRRTLPLASLDGDLRAAASLEGVRALGI
jgi:predicted nucleic acid-binding protein